MPRAFAPGPGWREHYSSHRISGSEAAALVRPGDTIYIPVAQQMGPFVAPLLGRADELRDVTVICFPTADYGWLSGDFEGKIDVAVYYGNPWTRAALDAHTIDYFPWMFYNAHKALAEGREGARRIDINLVNVTPPNEHGYVCLGNQLWDAKDAVYLAEKTVAIVNDSLPRTYGDTWLHVSELDWFVEEDPWPVAAATPPAPDPWDATIAGYAAAFINNGDTIQIGAGSTTGNFVRTGGLDEKADLSYFGELTVPGTVDRVRSGVITGRHLKTHPGKFVASTVGTSPEDREFVNGNPAFEIRGVKYVHDPRTLASNDNFVAINNALTVDLTGQIAAATIGQRIYSGTGGHFSFAMGAFMSRGGRYVCLLPATAKSGTVSRIVSQFAAGQAVTVPRELADIVVSEFGVAKLLNKSVRERTEALIAIAHPDFRAELRREAQRLFWP